MEATETELETMFRQYVETALWSSVLQDGSPMDDRYGPEDLSDEALRDMHSDCADFLKGAQEAVDAMLEEGFDIGQVGHDFWLTRNRHGAGFWDRGLGKVGDDLTAMAHPYGESDLYIGDDGLVYVA